MELIVKILKMLLGLLIGVAAGLLIAGSVIVLFTDTTLAEFIDRLSSVNLSDGIVAALVGIASLLVSVPILVLVHEAGHLICGLATGYRFVSFRIFSFTFIRTAGKIRVKRFAIAGTGGQCLLSPPEVPVEKIPVMWYNLGGVLANVIVFLCVLPLMWTGVHPAVKEFVVIFLLADLFMILTNGIPMQINGIGNDAYNMMLMRHNMESRRGLAVQLWSNALIQEGVRPKDMPDEWFAVPSEINYKNALEVSIPLMRASRFVDKEEWETAYQSFDELYDRRDEIMRIYVQEIACELAFVSMVTGRTDRAVELLDKELMKYIESYRRMMSSKERILCAVSLYIDHDRDKATEIYDRLCSAKESYLLQGEVKSDLAVMKSLLESQH